MCEVVLLAVELSFCISFLAFSLVGGSVCVGFSLLLADLIDRAFSFIVSFLDVFVFGELIFLLVAFSFVAAGAAFKGLLLTCIVTLLAFLA